jgi:hypothetical protein
MLLQSTGEDRPHQTPVALRLLADYSKPFIAIEWPVTAVKRPPECPGNGIDGLNPQPTTDNVAHQSTCRLARRTI